MRLAVSLVLLALPVLLSADPSSATPPAIGQAVECPILIYHGVREYRASDSPLARR